MFALVNDYVLLVVSSRSRGKKITLGHQVHYRRFNFCARDVIILLFVVKKTKKKKKQLE